MYNIKSVKKEKKKKEYMIHSPDICGNKYIYMYMYGYKQFTQERKKTMQVHEIEVQDCFTRIRTSHDRAPVHRSKRDWSKKGNQLSHLTSVSINL